MKDTLRSLRPTLIREAPWLGAATLSVFSILSVLPSLNHPWGSNWPMYFEAARYFWDDTAAYFGWRPPLYPLGLATLGGTLGYLSAAQWIARISMVLIVFSTGLMTRAIVSPSAAVLAVLTLPWLQCAVEGALWTNMYPPAAALLTLAVAAGAMGSAWRPAMMAGPTGLLAGFAWQVNHLGLVSLPMTLGLLLIGARKTRTVALIALLWGGGIGTAVGVNQWVVKRWEVPQDSLATQVLQRRREELDRLKARPPDADRFSACTDFEAKPLNLTQLTNSCALQFVRANYGTLRAEDCAPSPHTLLWLLPFTLLPIRKRPLKSIATSVLIFGGPLGAYALAAAWTSYAEKYALAFVGIMVLAIPLAFDRVGRIVGELLRRPGLGRGFGLVGAAVWIGLVWPAPNNWRADAPNVQQDWEHVSGWVADWARTHLGEDDLLLDCVPLSIPLVILPDTLPIRESQATGSTCRAWVNRPPAAQGTVWMVQRELELLNHTRPQTLQTAGWRLIQTLPQGHRLWRWQ